MCKRLYSVGRNADVIQPLAADFLARTVAHCLLYIVALAVGVKRIQPYKHHILILRLELGLTVDGP